MVNEKTFDNNFAPPQRVKDMEEFESDFHRLFNDWRNKWIDKENGPLPELKFLREILPKQQQEKNKEEFENRDHLIDFTAKYIEANKSKINIILPKLHLLFNSCFGCCEEKIYIDFLHRVFAKTVNSIEVS